MKKVFLLTLSLVLALGAFAQRQVKKNDTESFKVERTAKVMVGNESSTEVMHFAPQTMRGIPSTWFNDSIMDTETITTYYDLQSNGWCSNRMYQLPTGQVAVVATMNLNSNNPTDATRGSGYNFFNGDEFDDQPSERVEPVKTGWPTIAQYGETGEILISHAPTHAYIRTTAGQGEWQDMGALPSAPEGYPYSSTDYVGWPRVATSGDNHEIIHVIGDIQHAFSSGGSTNDSVWHYQIYYRSLDGAQTWEANYSPLQQDGMEGPHNFTADNYNIAANGHNVAVIYSDDLQSDVVMYKSTDDGATWTKTVVWYNPYAGCDWNDECSLYTDTMFGPSNTAIVIDNNGVVHVAMNTYEYIHDSLGDTYTTWSGLTVDGIYYWNDTQEAPIQSVDGNPHHALRLWWQVNDSMVERRADSTKWIGYIPTYYDEDGNEIEYDRNKFFREHDYFYKMRSGQSAMPAFSCDPEGRIACAFTTPCTYRVANGKYMRSIIVSYYNPDGGYWEQDVDEIKDFSIELQECIFTISANNTANPGEFWIGYQADEAIGCFVGSNAYQQNTTENIIHATRITFDGAGVAEGVAQNVINTVYPNPAKDFIVVSSSTSAKATITFVNLAGQTVKSIDKDLVLGENTVNIDLESGVYFCTVSANGFNKTVKVVVK